MKKESFLPPSLIILAFLTSSTGVLANDGVYMTSGNQLVPLVETDIRIDREVLRIYLDDSGYASIDVLYEMFNPNGEKTILMGFEADPPYNAGAEFSPAGVHPLIRGFSVEMNGQAIPYATAVCAGLAKEGMRRLDPERWRHPSLDRMAQEMGLMDNTLYDAQEDSVVAFSYVSYFSATFPPGRSLIRHTYSYALSYDICTLWTLDYKLTPCTRWAGGKVGAFTLEIIVEDTAKDFLLDAGSEFSGQAFTLISGQGKQRTIQDSFGKSLTQMVLRSGVFRIEKSDFRPEKELRILSSDHLLCNGKPFPLGTFYDRSDRFRPETQKFQSTDVSHLDRRILRNLPYAHRGYIFKDKKLRDYFSEFFWYMPSESYRASLEGMTRQEQRYIDGTFQ